MVRSRLGSVLWIVATIAILVTANLLVALGRCPPPSTTRWCPLPLSFLFVLARVRSDWGRPGSGAFAIRPSLPYAAAAIVWWSRWSPPLSRCRPCASSFCREVQRGAARVVCGRNRDPAAHSDP